MTARRGRQPRLSLIERALVEKEWHATNVRAQIHAILGDDRDEFVNTSGRVLYVVLGALIADQVDPDLPEVRIVRGACNALYEQAGAPTIADERRASIRAGLEACDRLIAAGLSRRSLTDAALVLEVKMRSANVLWGDFEHLLEGVSA